MSGLALRFVEAPDPGETPSGHPHNRSTTFDPAGVARARPVQRARFRLGGSGRSRREASERRRNGRCIVENRRRLHRQPAGWAASYQLAGEVASGWRDCRVVDISMHGAGITFDRNPAELSGRLVSVNLPGDGSSVNVRLEGKITNTAITMSRDIRVGIEFFPLSETEQAITAVLSVMSDVLVNASTPAVLIEASTASHRLVSGCRREREGHPWSTAHERHVNRRHGPGFVILTGSRPQCGATARSSTSRCTAWASRFIIRNPGSWCIDAFSSTSPPWGMLSISGWRASSGDAAFTLEGDIRVGIEFVGLSDDERRITAVLGGINRIEPEHAVPRGVR